jgi:SlyX protein
MPDKTSQRLQKIEAHVAHLEHQVDQLNQVIIDQGKAIEALKRQTQRQARTIESMEIDRIKATNSKPPHYSR